MVLRTSTCNFWVERGSQFNPPWLDLGFPKQCASGGGLSCLEVSKMEGEAAYAVKDGEEVPASGP